MGTIAKTTPQTTLQTSAAVEVPMPQPSHTTASEVVLPSPLAQRLGNIFDGDFTILPNSDASTPSLENGLAVKGRLKHCDYPLDTALYFPKGFNENLAQGNQLLIHLHGFLGRKSGVSPTFDAEVLELYKFDNLLNNSNLNGAVLAIPESSGHCDTYRKYFSEREAPEKFDSYLASLTTVLQDAEMLSPNGISNLALSAHSGAGKTVEHILSGISTAPVDSGRRKLNGLALLDAAYGSPTISTLANVFSEQHGDVYFLNAYTPHTANTSETHQRELDPTSYRAISGGSFTNYAKSGHFSLVQPELTKFWSQIARGINE